MREAIQVGFERTTKIQSNLKLKTQTEPDTDYWELKGTKVPALTEIKLTKTITHLGV